MNFLAFDLRKSFSRLAISNLEIEENEKKFLWNFDEILLKQIFRIKLIFNKEKSSN
jgi:hypothetical protein